LYAGTKPTAYTVSPAVHILAGIHDCSFILGRIRSTSSSSELLDDSQCGERGTFLVNAAGEVSFSAPIDPGTEAILALFQQPEDWRRSRDFCATLQVPIRWIQTSFNL
jgi:hypothetical protein